MQQTPAGLRPHIVLAGRRNAGKSSLINAVCGQPLALVSEVPGTTTDPVAKAFELLPFGPVMFVDTAGLDDEGPVGELRVARSKRELATADLVVLVTEAGFWTEHEQRLLAELAAAGRPVLVAVNKADLVADWRPPVADAVMVSALTGEGVEALRLRLIERLTEVSRGEPTLVGDLVKAGDLVALVVPIDLEAPKGRLILPQVMTIRDLLDHDAASVVVKERELWAFLQTLGRRPDLVICDSQAVLKVAGDLPPEIPLTTFSILMARFKGDLGPLVRGARIIDDLRDGDRILMAEACSHHPVGDDIGRVKLPRWIRQYTGRDLHFDYAAGVDFPADLASYRLVIHCGACMLTPRSMRGRQQSAAAAAAPMTNYGVAISLVHGVLDRALSPFGGPEVFR